MSSTAERAARRSQRGAEEEAGGGERLAPVIELGEGLDGLPELPADDEVLRRVDERATARQEAFKAEMKEQLQAQTALALSIWPSSCRLSVKSAWNARRTVPSTAGTARVWTARAPCPCVRSAPRQSPPKRARIR